MSCMQCDARLHTTERTLWSVVVCVCARFVYDSADQLTAWRSVLQSSISHALGDDKVPQPNTHRHTTTLALTQTQAL